nr:unnamed protein product [Digitaria exilis]
MPLLQGFVLRHFFPFLAVAHLLLPMAVARTNLTVGDILTPPDYTSPAHPAPSPSASAPTTPTQPSSSSPRGCNSSSRAPPPPQSVVWFAKDSSSSRGATANATARSFLSITTDGQLTLDDGSNNHVLWTTSSTSTWRGSVLTLTDSGNALFSLAAQQDGNVVLCADLFT